MISVYCISQTFYLAREGLEPLDHYTLQKERYKENSLLFSLYIKFIYLTNAPVSICVQRLRCFFGISSDLITVGMQ